MEESGWKLVHGDVFRPPQYPMILSSLLGSGIQLFCMILIVICECAQRGPAWGMAPSSRCLKERRVGFPPCRKGTKLLAPSGRVSISGPDGPSISAAAPAPAQDW